MPWRIPERQCWEVTSVRLESFMLYVHWVSLGLCSPWRSVRPSVFDVTPAVAHKPPQELGSGCSLLMTP